MNSAEFLTDYISRGGLLIALTCGLICLGKLMQMPAMLRHRLGMIGIVFVLLMPLLFLSGWQWAIIPSQSIESVAPIYIGSESAPVAVIELAKSENSLPSSTGVWAIDIHRLLLVLWIVGALSFAVFSIPGFAFLRRLNRAGSTNDFRLRKILDELLRSEEINTEIKLITSVQVMSPFTWGFMRPVIALPVESENWSNEKVRLVFLHELSHVIRRDALSLLLSRILVILNWFNPLAWYLGRKLENLREEVCDGFVLSKGVAPCDYADCLVQMASESHTSQNFSIAVAKTQTVETRVKMILSQPSKLMCKPRKILTCVSAGAIAMLAVFITTVTFAEVGKSKSLAEMQVKKLDEIIIPKVEFVNTPLKDAVNYLVHESRVRDTLSTKPEEKGVNVGLIGADEDIKITLKLSNIPLKKALLYVAGLSQSELEIRKHVVVMRHLGSKVSGAGRVRLTDDKTYDDLTNSTIGKKLDSLILPSVQFSDTPLKAALAYINKRSVDLDVDSSADQKGINIIVEGLADMPRVSLNLRNVSIGDLISLTAEAAGCRVEADEHAVFVKKIRQ